MSRSIRDTASPLARIAAAAALLVAAAPLSGCIASMIPEGSGPRPSASPSGESPVEPSTDPTGLPDTLTFEEGRSLPSTAYIEWGDGLILDDRWEIDSPDNGAGTWSHRTKDGTCTATFWQGTLDGLESSGDDRTASDAVIALVLKADAADVTENADEGAFAYQIGSHLDIENRVVTGTEGERTWIMAARAFTQPAVGMYLIVDCTGADTAAVMDEVVSKNPLIVTG